MPEEKDTSGEALARALELELAQKRLHWQRGREKYRTLRVLSFGFLFIIILAGLIAFFFFFSRTNEMREQRPQLSPAACDRGKDSIGHVEDTASSRLAELTPRKAHPGRNTDSEVCAPSRVLVR